MSLKSLTFSSIPHKSVDPTIRRRERLVEKLQEQLQLIKNPNFKPTFNRWETNEDGERVAVEKSRTIKPWWFTDLQGDMYLIVKVGHKKVEFEKGKSAIKVGSKDNLETVLNTVISATESGELDKMLPDSHFSKSITK
tara:strand:- start:22 stop:435 length:414 start_codon:yes stop_codon:yes gene_type:complete